MVEPATKPLGIKSESSEYIMLICSCNLQPLIINFYNLSGVYRDLDVYFSFLLKKTDPGYSLKPHQLGVLMSTHNLRFEQK